MKADAEGQAEDYKEAIPDELALHLVEASNPSGKFIEEDSLANAATLECHVGRFQSGIDHARQVIRESGSDATAQPLFVNVSNFTIAECLLGEQELPDIRHNPVVLHEVAQLLRGVNVPLVSQFGGNASFPGSVAVAQARLALLERQPTVLKAQLAKAEAFLRRPDADPYERRAFAHMKARLQPNHPDE